MRMKLPVVFTPLLAGVVVILVVNVGTGQTIASPQSETGKEWKSNHLAELDRQLAVESVKGSNRDELIAQRDWLANWTPGGMSADPRSNPKLPSIRSEPIIDTRLAKDLRKKLENETEVRQDEAELLLINQALVDHPDDPGLQQLHLHWLDDPSRRKTHLKRVDSSALRLIQSLEPAKKSDPTIRLAIEFAMYRRGRALAYRELPDVLRHTPIDDPQRLNQMILSAHRDLFASAGKRHPEFILLEIRILRRAKKFGSALSLVEQYGSTIKRQWYLKKRRDLLKELGWSFPRSEAAEIYAAKFPEEVAREISRKQ